MNVTLTETSDQFWRGTRMLFYLIDPAETTFKDPEQVPDYWKEVKEEK